MSLRLPQTLPSGFNAETGVSILNSEILAEKAAALGRAEQQAGKALGQLKSYRGSPEDRAAVLQSSIDAVYAYFIQRELCGFPNHEDPIKHLDIPREVVVRLGAR